MMLFNESIKSKHTRRNYVRHLKKFKEYANISTYEGLLAIPKKRLQMLLEDYLMHLKRTSNPNSVSTMFLGLRHFFIMNRTRLDWEIIQKMYPQKTRTVRLRAWTKSDIKKMIDVTRNRRDAALFYFLASTGARVGAFEHDLSLKYIRRMPNGCIGVLIYAGASEEYWGFLTPQASKRLDSYLDERKKDGEELTDSTPLFRNTYSRHTVHDVRKLDWSGARSIIYRTITDSKACREKHGSRYDIQASHGFRKFFNTTLKLNMDVNYNIAEKLMGHKNGLDGVYLTPTIEQCFTEFRKAIQDLTL